MLLFTLAQLSLGDIVALLGFIGTMIAGYISLLLKNKALEIKFENFISTETMKSEQYKKIEEQTVQQYRELMSEIKEMKENSAEKFELFNDKFNELLLEVTKRLK